MILKVDLFDRTPMCDQLARFDVKPTCRRNEYDGGEDSRRSFSRSFFLRVGHLLQSRSLDLTSFLPSHRRPPRWSRW